MDKPLYGIMAMVVACTIWGLSGIYYKQLAHIPPLEVLAHRTIWSGVFFGFLLVFQKRVPEAIRTLKTPKVMLFLCLTAVFISINWFVFIFSIQAGYAMEASFGYYIFPLVAVALGFCFLGEKPSKMQWFAILIATIAVIILGFGLGAAPWIALILALTFGLYGLLKKSIPVGPVMSVFLEVVILLPLAIGWLFFVHSSGQGAFATNYKDSALLAFSGLLTGGPLFLFAFAAKRVSLTTMGLVQYLNPTLQFSVAYFLFGELFTHWHAIAFALIWTGLGIYTTASWHQERSLRKRSISVGTSSMT